MLLVSFIVTYCFTASYVRAATMSALDLARGLSTTAPLLREGGEYEDDTFWIENAAVLDRAWKEYGHLHESLYHPGNAFERRYLTSKFNAAVVLARGPEHDESDLKELFREAFPGIWVSSESFTPEFSQDLHEELDHRKRSGIPQRRPNGMNRYGDILSDSELHGFVDALVDAYARPIAQMLFDEYASRNGEDMDFSYAFLVRYDVDEGDRDLAPHRDASVVTMNVCLGKEGYEGGALQFETHVNASLVIGETDGERRTWNEFHFGKPGTVVFHRGMTRHQALPLISGERANLVVWIFGRQGDVRVKPYEEAARLTPSERWIRKSSSSFASSPSSSGGDGGGMGPLHGDSEEKEL
eukprot:g1672.t1